MLESDIAPVALERIKTGAMTGFVVNVDSSCPTSRRRAGERCTFLRLFKESISSGV